MACLAKIRPMMHVNTVEIQCSLGDADHKTHNGVLRDYAYPGSETRIIWQEEDRRTFRGDWTPCLNIVQHCILPGDHHGRCVT